MFDGEPKQPATQSARKLYVPGVAPVFTVNVMGPGVVTVTDIGLMLLALGFDSSVIVTVMDPEQPMPDTAMSTGPEVDVGAGNKGGEIGRISQLKTASAG